MLRTGFLHLHPLLLMHDRPPTVSAGKCHPPAALTGRFQPPGKAEVAGAAHRVLLATHYWGHTQSREKLSNPQTAWDGGGGGGANKHTLNAIIGLWSWRHSRNRSRIQATNTKGLISGRTPLISLSENRPRFWNLSVIIFPCLWSKCWRWGQAPGYSCWLWSGFLTLSDGNKNNHTHPTELLG